MNKTVLVAVSVLLSSYNLCTAQITSENDSLFFKQKQLFEKLEVFSAWETTKGNSNIIMVGASTKDVTSLAALVYSIAPDMTTKEIRRVIFEGCDDIGEKDVDIYTGHGCINFGKTIALVKNHK